MNYEQSLEFIHSLDRFGSKPGTERIGALCRALGDPQNKLKFIHIAGTNGKGSVSAMLSAVLRAAGYRTGTYVSPYIINFRERIQLNGEFIAKDELAELTEKVKGVWQQLPDDNKPTEFEFITAVAFDYFLQKKCDVVVLETGLGGRLDATNIINEPICSVITSIGLDHTEVLGDTVEQIAAEKCGIIKNGRPVITECNGNVLSVIQEHCRAAAAPLFAVDCSRITDIKTDANGMKFNYCGEDYKLSLCGEYQAFNAACAVRVIKECFPDISSNVLKNGLKSAFLPARFEIISTDPLVILDGTHNPAGAEALARSLSKIGARNFTAIIGAMADKDVDAVLRLLSPFTDEALCVTVPNMGRSMSAVQLCKKAKSAFGKARAVMTIDDALQSAKNSGNNVLIFGSLYLASAIRDRAIETFKK